MTIDRLLRALMPAVALTAAGCATYSCPLPKEGGGSCRSVAQVYHDTLNDHEAITPSASLPPQDRRADHDHAKAVMAIGVRTAHTPPPPGPDTALLSRPRVLRVYVAPWQDREGTLHAGNFIFLRLDHGQWNIGP
jgi:type IV conjugative transfer system lipoprotein TraV